jgi:hypothetical protein
VNAVKLGAICSAANSEPSRVYEKVNEIADLCGRHFVIGGRSGTRKSCNLPGFQSDPGADNLEEKFAPPGVYRIDNRPPRIYVRLIEEPKRA